MKSRSGQIALFLLFVLIVLVFLTLLNVDTFIAVRAKTRLQNGGDAAALAAAHKQGALLNEIGRLNLRHLELVCTNTNGMSEAEIAQLRAQIESEAVRPQRELALFGPIEALRLANEAAKKNGMEEREEFARILRDHIATIRLVYAGGDGSDGDPYPEPFPGAWTDYATRLENVINEGLATGPDNIEFYNSAGGHLLLMPEFYSAILGRAWCWFYFHAQSVLEDYTSYEDWDPLPAARSVSMDNSEVFPLHVESRTARAASFFTADEAVELLRDLSGVNIRKDDIPCSLFPDTNQTWFVYDTSAWHTWFNGYQLADDEDGYEFPLAGEIKPEYNVLGCAAATRCETKVSAVAISSTSDFTWSAAAKPFGTVTDSDGAAAIVTARARFVLPSFTSTRLVPLDAIGGGSLGTADYAWVTHIRQHLGDYLENGPRAGSSCSYCRALKTWESDSFRAAGVSWLKYHSSECRQSSGSGGGGTGGTSHGH